LALFFVGCADKTPSPDTNTTMTSMDDGADDFDDEFGGDDEVWDPLEGYNRAMTSFNDAAIHYILKPVSKGYNAVVPSDVSVGIGNFFDNLAYPIRLINNIFQGKFMGALSETGRFIINTTVGFLGFANVATDVYEIKERNEDFGQTLGYWGVPAGPHIVLPILGPTNLRDLTGTTTDAFIDPLNYYNWRSDYNLLRNSWLSIGTDAIESFNAFARQVEAYDAMTKGAIDLYPLMRNMYEQRRKALIAE
jgi:phospholipid-binding lipoprotein MlaA